MRLEFKKCAIGDVLANSHGLAGLATAKADLGVVVAIEASLQFYIERSRIRRKVTPGRAIQQPVV